jgi:hypothetical protein
LADSKISDLTELAAVDLAADDEFPIADTSAIETKRLTFTSLISYIKAYIDAVTTTFTNKTLTAPVINSPTGIVKGDVGLGNVDNTSDATKDAAVATLTNKTLTSPVINTPTGIVKGDVGLGNVDNTSDATKNAASVTLTNKTLTSPVINSPTGLVKADVGLGSVDNTSDTTKDAAATTLTNKTIDEAIITGTPDAEGEFGQDTTQNALNAFVNGMLGTIPKVIEAGVGTQTEINDVATDQDFTAIYTLPANVLFTDKIFRVTLFWEYISGTAAITAQEYIKLGSTKVWTQATAQNMTDGLTRSWARSVVIIGRAAAGAAAAVTSMGVGAMNLAATMNSVDQPVNLATNGTLDIIPGVTFSGTGSTESMELQGWIVEELN